MSASNCSKINHVIKLKIFLLCIFSRVNMSPSHVSQYIHIIIFVLLMLKPSNMAAHSEVHRWSHPLVPAVVTEWFYYILYMIMH